MSLTQINRAGLDEIALDHVFTIGASGSSAYTFQGEGLNGTVNNPTLYLTRGKTYRFENGSGGHPIRIQSTSGASGTAYNTGVTNNAGSGTVIVEVQHDAPDVLYYQCTSHAAMNGILYITGALADGGVTTAKIADSAVTTAKIANGAINNTKITDGEIIAAKIADNNVTTSKINNLAVTTDKIANEAVTLAKLPHGTSSNDGKFLRANNGADPTFETVTGTTINNNANNRIITGSGSANTLEAESGFTYNGNLLHINSGSGGLPKLRLQHSGSGNDVFEITGGLTGISNGGFGIYDVDASAYRFAVNSSGQVGIGTASPVQQAGRGLHIHGTDQARVKLTNTNSGSTANDGFDIIQEGDSDIHIVNHENMAMKFGTNATERMRIDSNGQLLIGTTQSSAYGTRQLAVGDVSQSASYIEIRTSGTGTGHLLFSQTAGSSSGNYQGYIGYNQSSNHFSFHTGGGTQRARIDSDGLKFNADTAAANALDDYEEGNTTWAIEIGGVQHGNYSVNSGPYIKIGALVYCQVALYVTNIGGGIYRAGAVDISGLPFTATQNSYGEAAFLAGNHNNSSIPVIFGAVHGNGTRIRLRRGGSLEFDGNKAHNQNGIGATFWIHGTVIYKTNS